MATKLDKIKKQEKKNVFIEPDGSISKKRFTNGVIVKNLYSDSFELIKRVSFDLSRIEKYKYDSDIGVVCPNDDEIAEAAMRGVSLPLNKMKRLANKFKKVPDILADEEDENLNIKYISDEYRQGGSGEVFEDGRYSPTIHTPFNETGGMKYTFGVELETSAGRLTSDDLLVANTSMEGDRTITAFEYVSNILAGNKGLLKVKSLLSAISKRTIIGRENGLHIHIGGLETSKKVWTPNFNRMFSINAIKLGNQIEDEMLSIIHPNRRGDRYLKSIKPWGNINNSNWREVLGDYVFRGSEDPFRRYEAYETHTLDNKYNSNFRISRWAKTKHKWMNLNHCNAVSHVNTIEFRLFSATGSYEKAESFILLSLAIVWFIENKQRLIWNDTDVTLEAIIINAYKNRGHEKISKKLLNFIKKRKRMFNKIKIKI